MILKNLLRFISEFVRKLAIFAFFMSFTVANYTIKDIKDDTPIIFTKLSKAHAAYESYTAVFWIDLEEYFDLHLKIEQCINITRRICANDDGAACSLYSRQLKIKLMEITRDDGNIMVFRQKRHIQMLGDFLHWSTGVMDAETAQQWADHINKIKNETELQHEIVANHTAIFQTFLSNNKESMKVIQGYINDINNNLSHAQKGIEDKFGEIDKDLLHMRLNAIASDVLEQHTRPYAQIRRVLIDSRRNEFPELSSKEVRQSLLNISKNLRITQRLPIDLREDNALSIFHFTSIKSTLHDAKLLIELIVPIAETESFTLVKSTPIPIETENGRAVVGPRHIF